MNKLDRLIEIIRILKEEGMIANVVGTGEKSLGFNLQTETPPVFKKSKYPILARKRMSGVRTRWERGLS